MVRAAYGHHSAGAHGAGGAKGAGESPVKKSSGSLLQKLQAERSGRGASRSSMQRSPHPTSPGLHCTSWALSRTCLSAQVPELMLPANRSLSRDLACCPAILTPPGSRHTHFGGVIRLGTVGSSNSSGANGRRFASNPLQVSDPLASVPQVRRGPSHDPWDPSWDPSWPLRVAVRAPPCTDLLPTRGTLG